MENLKKIKVRIKNDEEFKKIQKKVFEKNGAWQSGKKYILKLNDFGDLNFFGLVIDYGNYDLKNVKFGLNISYIDIEEEFNELDAIELTFEEIMKIENLKDYILNEN